MTVDEKVEVVARESVRKSKSRPEMALALVGLKDFLGSSEWPHPVTSTGGTVNSDFYLASRLGPKSKSPSRNVVIQKP